MLKIRCSICDEPMDEKVTVFALKSPLENARLDVSRLVCLFEGEWSEDVLTCSVGCSEKAIATGLVIVDVALLNPVADPNRASLNRLRLELQRRYVNALTDFM